MTTQGSYANRGICARVQWMGLRAPESQGRADPNGKYVKRTQMVHIKSG